MKSMADGCIDLVVTSPPYNLGIKYKKYQDAKAQHEYLAWCRTWATEIKRILKEDGSFFLNLGACPSNPLLPHKLIIELSELFVLQNTFHWIKSITVQTKKGDLISAGHFKPLRGQRFANDCHEFVFHLTKTGQVQLNRLGLGVPYSHKSNIARWGHTKGQDLRCRGNNWFIPYQTIISRNNDRPHPATFPTELALNCIKIHGTRPDLVMLDPFLGIGHAALAAKLGAVGTFYGFEIDPSYVEVARTAVQSGSTRVEGPRRTSIRRPKKNSGASQPSLFGDEN
jgi:site-specific DNA-methyltransferase (adenine-specific)